MNHHALMVVADEMKTFHWVLLTIDGQRFEPHSYSQGEFDTYELALSAGALALATADRRAHVNDPAASAGRLAAPSTTSDGLGHPAKGWPWAQAESISPG